MNRRVTPAAPKPISEVPTRLTSAERHALPRVGVRQWLLLHRRAAVDALSRLWSRKLASVMGLLLTGLAMAFPLLLATMSRNLDRLIGGLQSSGEIAVFLEPGIAAERAREIADTLRARANIAAITVRTPSEGLRELQSIPGFDEAIAAAGANPLPYLLLVRPREDGDAALLADEFAAMPQVDQVQYDRQWRDRLQRMLALLQRLAIASAALFALVAVLVVGNHVRLEVAMRREEIGIVKLLGANDSFVRRPFLWSGFWLGTFGALLAIATALAVRAYFAAPVHALAESYGSDFVLRGPDVAILLTTLACGVLLGSIGAYLASTLQLATDRAS